MSNTKYKYRLTEHFENKENLRGVIAQIEKYEGKGKGYELRKKTIGRIIMKKGKDVRVLRDMWAVYTDGVEAMKKREVNKAGLLWSIYDSLKIAKRLF